MRTVAVLDLIKNISLQLRLVCSDQPAAEQEAWWILQHVFRQPKAALLLSGYVEFTEQNECLLDSIIDQRVVQYKPLAYVLGDVPFCDLNILVSPPVLIPRPETEEWTLWLISLFKKKGISNFSILDLCCGSGCIGLAIARAFSYVMVTGVDISEVAVKLSNENKFHNNLTNINFVRSNLFDNLSSKFKCDVIVSNPPYLAQDEYQDLDSSVKLWEDKDALVADDFGMFFYEKILTNARRYLNKIDINLPQIIFEIGPRQEGIEDILKAHGYNTFDVFNDMQGKKRWVAIYL